VDRLKALVKGGGKVLFLGRTPSLISGKSIMDSHAATPADFAWAVVETSAQLPTASSRGRRQRPPRLAERRWFGCGACYASRTAGGSSGDRDGTQ